MIYCTSFPVALASLLVSATAVKGWVWSVGPTTGTAPRVSGQAAAAAAASSSSSSTTTTTTDFQKNNPALLLFGGLTGAAGSPTTDQTWTYDKAKGRWDRLVETTASRPRQRMYAASAIVSDKFYLLGGWDPGAPGSGGEFLDDIWCLDLQSKDWKKLDAKLPYPVSRHAGCAIGNSRIVVHTFKGLLVFDCDSGSVTEQPTTGEAPDGLSMCAIAPLNNGNSLLLFGGSTKTQQLSGDTYVLDTTTWKWNKQQQQLLKDQKDDDDASIPGPRASACAASVGGNQVVVFGGASIGSEGYGGGMGLVPLQDTWLATVVVVQGNTNTNTNDDKVVVEWTKLDTKTSPEGRVAATICALGDGTFLMQGGYDPISKSTFEEPWVLKEQE
jgi:hypothetical protein